MISDRECKRMYGLCRDISWGDRKEFQEVFAYISLMVDVRFYAQMFTLALPYLAEVKIAFNRIQVNNFCQTKFRLH